MWVNICIPIKRSKSETIDSFATKLQDALDELRHHDEIVTVMPYAGDRFGGAIIVARTEAS